MKLIIELTDVSEYEKVAKTLLALHAGFSQAVIEPEVKPKAKKAKAEAEPAPVTPAEADENQLEIDFEQPAPEPAPVAVAAEAPVAVAAGAPVPTQDQARDALSAYSVKHGMTAARALLEKYGAQRVSDIKDDQRAAFIAEMDV